MTGGFAATPDEGGDCCEPCDPCAEVIEVDPCDPCGEFVDPCGQPIQEILDDGCGCGPMSPYGQVPVEHMGETVIGDLSETGEEEVSDVETTESQAVAEDSGSDEDSQLGGNEALGKPSFLKRFANWLSLSSFTNS